MKSIVFLVLSTSFIFVSQAFAQSDSLAIDTVKEELNVVQLTGLIVEGDSMYGMPYVSIYVPNSPRGTITNSMGYFSMPVYELDTVEIDMIGYNKEKFPIPKGTNENFSIIVHLIPDTVILAVIEIYPYPNLEAFTNAFLTAELNKNDIENMKKNLNERLLKRMLYHSDMDGSMNHHYFTENYVTRIETQNFMTPIPLLNPFAWVRFIKDVKKYRKLKKEGYYDYLEDEK